MKFDNNSIEFILNILNLNYFIDRKDKKRTPLRSIYNFEIVNLNLS